MKTKIDKKAIIRQVKLLDPKLEETDEAFKVATILLTATIVGADNKKIAKALKIRETEIKKYEKNLRNNGIWVKEMTYANWYKKDTIKVVEFWIDVLTAQGYVERTKEKK